MAGFKRYMGTDQNVLHTFIPPSDSDWPVCKRPSDHRVSDSDHRWTCIFAKRGVNLKNRALVFEQELFFCPFAGTSDSMV